MSGFYDAQNQQSLQDAAEADALAQAANAAASATQASQSETDAQTHATAAASSSASASVSAADAAANNQASASNNSASSASATASELSKQAAETAETNAVSAQTSALASKNAAATSETNAFSSATSSASSAAGASASATSSASSATEASASATGAAASLSVFDTVMLGAKASAPTSDNEGGALIQGSLYFDSGSQQMQVYSAAGWKPAGSAVNGTAARFKYVSTDNQATFSGADANNQTLAYDVGFIDVFLSGLRLVNGTDFTATNGTSIVLAEGAATGDILELVAFGAFEIAGYIDDAADSNIFTDADHSKLDGIEASADVTDSTNVQAAGALMDSEVNNLAAVKAFDSSDYATAAQGTKADAALPTTGGAMTGAITTNSTFDGRDVATDGTKLDGIEASADVTDATNVQAAGALMDSEVTDLAAVKALNQGVSTTDSPTVVGLTCSTGYITAPNQPAFSVTRTSSASNSAAATDDLIEYNSVLLNVGSGYSTTTSRFTAPTTGNYFFSVFAGLISSSTSARYVRVRLKKNGTSTIVLGQHSHISDETGDTDYAQVSMSGVVALAAGDYVAVYWATSAATGDVGLTTFRLNNHFSGHLIG